MHHSPRSVKIAVERHDDDGFALPAAIHGYQSSRLPKDLADDADDEDAVPCVVDSLAAGVVLREIRVERALFFHEGFELPKVDGIAKPEQERSGFLRMRRIGHFRERRVMGVRAMHLVHILMRIALYEVKVGMQIRDRRTMRRAMTPGVSSKGMIDVVIEFAIWCCFSPH